MLLNFLKIAARTLRRNKRFTFLNLIGLAFGLATCLLIVLNILDERGYDCYNAAAIVSILITFITISYQSVKASMVNPVESLKNQ